MIKVENVCIFFIFKDTVLYLQITTFGLGQLHFLIFGSGFKARKKLIRILRTQIRHTDVPQVKNSRNFRV